MHVLLRSLIFALTCTLPFEARGEERHIQWVASVGALEVVSFEAGHEGLYPTIAAGAAFPVGDYASLIPTLGVEWAPENGRWGAVATLTYDQPFAEWIGADATLILGEDHAGSDVSDALVFVGIGLGPAFYAGQVVLAPSVNWLPGPGGGALAPAFFASLLF